MKDDQAPSKAIQERKRILEAGFDAAMPPSPPDAIRFAFDVLCSNAFVMVALIVNKGNTPNAADDIFEIDHFLSAEICIDAITRLVDADASLLDQENHEAWTRLTSASQRIRCGEIGGPTLVAAVYLLACAVYLIDRRLGRTYLPKSHFPETYLSWLSTLSPPIVLEPIVSQADLLNCLLHLEHQLEKKRGEKKGQ